MQFTCEERSAASRNTFQAYQQMVGRRAFALDSKGSLITVDRAGDLIRVDPSGASEVWVPALTTTYGAWDMRFLPNGDLVATDATGALLRVTPEGATDAILSGLESPSRVAAGSNDSVFVSEEGPGRIREVELATGNSAIIASGLDAPGAMAVSQDANTLYVASRSAGIVYVLDRTPNGRWSAPRELARTPNAPGNPVVDVCVGKEAGDPCDEYRQGYRCDDTPMGLLCRAPDPCTNQSAGEPCTTLDGVAGECQDLGLGLTCGPLDPCADAQAGDSCIDGTHASGICTEDPWLGELYCGIVGPCYGGEVGDECMAIVWDELQAGVCVELDGGRLGCSTEATNCSGLAEGDTCLTDWNTAGTCTETEGTPPLLLCEENPPPCEDAVEGDPCISESGAQGTCSGMDEALDCLVPPPCEGLSDGDECTTDWNEPGVCIVYDEDYAYCEPVGPCYGLADGADCLINDIVPGICEEYGPGEFDCVPAPPCDGLAEGDECFDYFGVGEGTCRDDGEGGLECVEPNPCDNLAEGDSCEFQVDYTGSIEGSCAYGTDGYLTCQKRDTCQGLAESDPCDFQTFSYNDYTWITLPGRCELGRVVCEDTCHYANDNWCDDGGDRPWSSCDLGTDCSDCGSRVVVDDEPSSGQGEPDAVQVLTCALPPPCENKAPGDSCTSPDVPVGECVLVGSGSNEPNGGAGGGANAPTNTSGASGSGSTEKVELECVTANSCEHLDAGAPCLTEWGAAGRCLDDLQTGILTCDQNAPGAGQLGALAVDPCGYVYVFEDVWANLWRIAPDGSEVERVIELPSVSLSAAAWGSGVGEWKADTLYLLSETRPDLYAIPILTDNQLGSGPSSQ